MTRQFATGFLKRAHAAGLSRIEAEVLFNKYAAQMPGGAPPEEDPHAAMAAAQQGGGHPGGPPGGGHGGGAPEVTVGGQPLPPELAHVVLQVLSKVMQSQQGGGQPGGQAGGPPPGGHPGMPA